VVFVDSNVPMYLVGAAHPNRDRLAAFVLSNTDEIYVTSAEVYQEVIHRYIAINRREAIASCFALLDDLVAHVYPITRADTDAALAIASRQQRLSGRDCLHLAIMERYGAARILTCDRDFEMWPGIICLPAS
jgi:predicted nucleic acid-binding protein